MEIARYAVEVAKEGEAVACGAYLAMIRAFKKGENAFDCLNDFLGLDLPVTNYLQLYQNHRPQIRLPEDVKETLSTLKSAGYKLALISDGRSLQQRNKIHALDLTRWFDTEDIIISEEFGSEKPSPKNYEYFMNRYPGTQYTYVGDNPQKDFLAPNHLGWETICLLDNGCNIHKQDFTLPEIYLPKKKIKGLSEICKIIDIHSA